mmetsp:Transcript_284/g.501  ORF Transcript_284/g.501 Transcript_284/m.501 type:complete len:224 (-) Transcript_284:1728-2399(-)
MVPILVQGGVRIRRCRRLGGLAVRSFPRATVVAAQTFQHQLRQGRGTLPNPRGGVYHGEVLLVVHFHDVHLLDCLLLVMMSILRWCRSIVVRWRIAVVSGIFTTAYSRRLPLVGNRKSDIPSLLPPLLWILWLMMCYCRCRLFILPLLVLAHTPPIRRLQQHPQHLPTLVQFPPLLDPFPRHLGRNILLERLHDLLGVIVEQQAQRGAAPFVPQCGRGGIHRE